MRRVFCYVRYSSKRQSAGDSLDRQAESIQDFATRMNAEIAEEYQDLGVSAFRGRNVKVGALGRFLQRVTAGEITKGDILIVESLDRISRQKEFDTIAILMEILRNGVIIHTLVDGQTYDIESEQQANLIFQMNFIISRARDESVTKQKRSKSAWRKKHLEAKQEQRVITSKLPYWLYLEEIEGKKVIKVNDDRADEVRFAFNLATYKLGAQAIATRMNERGCQKRWSLIGIRHLLDSKSVYGSLEIYKTKSLANALEKEEIYEEVEGYFPAVISKEEFYRVRHEISVNKEIYALRGRASKGFRNVFKGLITCGFCGSKLHQNFLRRKGHEYMYLVCQRSLVGACGVQSKLLYTYDRILKCFILLYKRHRLDSLILKKSAETKILETIKSLNAERDSKQHQVDRLTEALSLNVDLSSKSVMALISTLEKQIAILENEVNALEGLAESEKASEKIKERVSQEVIEELLDNEEGRLQFNDLLSKNRISIVMQREYHGKIFEQDEEDTEAFPEIPVTLVQKDTSHSTMTIVYQDDEGRLENFAYVQFDRYKAKFNGGAVYEFATQKFWCNADYDFITRKFKANSRAYETNEEAHEFLSSAVL